MIINQDGRRAILNSLSEEQDDLFLHINIHTLPEESFGSLLDPIIRSRGVARGKKRLDTIIPTLKQ